jgi:hypothetical protein
MTTTWRDIADQLTPDQYAELQDYEHAGDGTDTLLFRRKGRRRGQWFAALMVRAALATAPVARAEFRGWLGHRRDG